MRLLRLNESEGGLRCWKGKGRTKRKLAHRRGKGPTVIIFKQQKEQKMKEETKGNSEFQTSTSASFLPPHDVLDG